MPTDPDEQVTFEALRKFATEAEAYAYRERMARRREVIEEHERRLAAVENGLSAVQVKLQDISSEAHETRIEQNSTLAQIAAKVEQISREQMLEAGRKEGAAIVAAAAARSGDRRDAWLRTIFPMVLGLGAYLLAQFVVDVISAAP